MGDSLEQLLVHLEECIFLLNATDRDREISRYYYGIAEPRYYPLQEIGEKYGVTRERVRQIVKRNERKIRALFRKYLKAEEFEHPAIKFVSYYSAIVDEKGVDWTEEITYIASVGMPNIPLHRSLKSLIRVYLPPKAAQRLIEEIQTENDSEFIFKNISWSTGKKKYPTSVMGRLTPQRKTRGEYKGVFYSEKNDRDIHYESGLELSFIQGMEESQHIVSYCEQAIAIKFSYKGKQHRYYPDFVAMTSDGSIFVVEVKPVMLMGEYSNLRKWMALRTYCEERGFGIIITDGQTTFSQLSNRTYSEDVAQRVHQYIARGKKINWIDLKRAFGTRITKKEFVSLILQNRFKAFALFNKTYVSLTIEGFL
ncbi:TnsA endonuclease N-terminal domain-containing protein [Priestia filamentosa]|uniref:TnsA endonuclease N-terminal domain-containing protein n=1 Tax=Priestia filamentosa TaxID=1402861 RepID=UPI0039819D67